MICKVSEEVEHESALSVAQADAFRSYNDSGDLSLIGRTFLSDSFLIEQYDRRAEAEAEQAKPSHDTPESAPWRAAVISLP